MEGFRRFAISSQQRYSYLQLTAADVLAKLYPARPGGREVALRL